MCQEAEENLKKKKPKKPYHSTKVLRMETSGQWKYNFIFLFMLIYI